MGLVLSRKPSETLATGVAFGAYVQGRAPQKLMIVAADIFRRVANSALLSSQVPEWRRGIGWRVSTLSSVTEVGTRGFRVGVALGQLWPNAIHGQRLRGTIGISAIAFGHQVTLSM